MGPRSVSLSLDDLAEAGPPPPGSGGLVCPRCSAAGGQAGGRCTGCDLPLPIVCSGCGAPSQQAARFCAECGTRLAVAQIGGALHGLLSPQAARELRPLTVLFADIVGSCELAAALDPEEFTEIVGAFCRAVSATVTQHGAHLGHFVGDAAMVYFGYPTAQEDDAERAVYAALAIIETVAALPPRGGRRLDVRIGLSNGLVMVGDVASAGDGRNTGAYGETPNLAARLQALAEPNAVLVSGSVRRLVGALFEFRDLGAHLMKGWPEPVAVWQVLRPRRNVSRFEARGGAAAVPLLGREAPLARLHALWRAAQAGEGRTVLVSGEAGIGKSRLAAQLLRETPSEAHLRYFVAPHQQAMPLRPAIHQLERDSGFGRDDPAPLRLAKLRALLPDLGAADFALLAELLFIRDDSLPSMPPMAPQRRRERLLQALFGTFATAAKRGPILAVYEDAHWADPATRELLDLTAREIAGLPMLLVVTGRPEYRPDWLLGPNTECLALDQLSQEESATLARAVARDTPLPLGTVRDIVHRSDGVPLYVEELTRAVAESIAQGGARAGDRRLRESVPISLHASLLARLDRLGPAREVAEVAAVVGREFSAALLALVLGCEEAALAPALQRLKEAGLVLRGGTGAGATHRFKHALLQDAAQAMITRERYRALHARVADLLEGRGSGAPAAVQPHLVAHHRTEAGQAEQAIAWWFRGAREALLRSAVEEALVQLRRGIALLPELPDTPAKHQAELEMQLLVGNALLATKGHAAPETGEAFARARAVCDRLPGTPLLMNAMHGQYGHALMRGELASAVRRAEELLAIGERTGADDFLLAGCRAVGLTSYFLGDFARSVAMLRRAIGYFDPAQRHRYSGITVHDPEISMRCYAAWGTMWLGGLGAARREAEEALRDARAMGHFYTVAHALFTVAYVDLNAGAEERGLACMREALRLSEARGVPYFEMVSKIMCGVAIGRRGETEAGLAMVREGIAWHRATESYSYLPGFLASEGELAARFGDPAGGLEHFAEAFARMEQSGARWDEAELHRQWGEALRHAGRGADAESALRRAVAIAARSGAPLRHLQCGLSLAERLAQDGRRDAARAALAPALDPFAGEDAPIVQRARRLLDGTK